MIHPVGVGNAEGVSIPLRLPDGRQDFVRDSSGQPVQTRLDESSLRQLAEATNGSYAAFGRGAEGLEQIYAEKLRLVPPEEREAKMQKVPLERFEWPLGAALLLLLMEFLFPDRRREARPQALPSAARRKGLPVALLTALFLTGLPEPSAAADATAPDPRVLYNTGTEAYNAGKFDEAEQALRSSLHTADLTLQNQAYYNLGNTLYRKGAAAEGEDKVKTWEGSLKAYEDALALNPSDADAQYNRDLVKRKLDELKQQDPQKNQDQKDKDQQKKDEEKKEQEKKDGQEKKEDQQSGDGEKKEGEEQEDKGEQGTGKEQGEQGEKKEGEQKQGQQGEEKEGQEGKEGTGAKEGEQGEKKEGQAAGKDGEKKDGKEQEGQAASEGDSSKSTDEERRQPGEMNREEALRLLQAMKSQERTVIPVQRDPETGQPMPRQNPNRRGRDPANSTRGKTW